MPRDDIMSRLNSFDTEKLSRLLKMGETNATQGYMPSAPPQATPGPQAPGTQPALGDFGSLWEKFKSGDRGSRDSYTPGYAPRAVVPDQQPGPTAPREWETDPTLGEHEDATLDTEMPEDEEREKLLRYVLKPKRPGVKLFLGAEDDPELAQLAHMLRVQKERV